ncbi:MAG: hypothetical protein HC844_08480 [Tabrizicola sp.]|nr:hypothetical protein [Tabrizicola sp.]
MKKEQITKAVALGELMDMATSLGAAITVGERDEVYLVSGDAPPRKIGDSLVAAASELKRLVAPAALPGNGVLA